MGAESTLNYSKPATGDTEQRVGSEDPRKLRKQRGTVPRAPGQEGPAGVPTEAGSDTAPKDTEPRSDASRLRKKMGTKAGVVPGSDVLSGPGAPPPRPPQQPATPLERALRGNNEETALALIREGATVPLRDLSKDTNAADPALVLALEQGMLKAADALVKRGADVNGMKFRNPLLSYFLVYRSQEKGLPETIRFLCEHHADLERRPENDGRTALMIASSRGLRQIVETLLSYGAKIDARYESPPGYGSSDEGGTALSYAADHGHQGIVELLIGKGADGTIKRRNGYSNLILAILMKHPEIARILIVNKADVNAETIEGITPLKAALNKKDLQTARLLVEKGANVRAKSMRGFIFSLMDQKEFASVRFMIENGQDLNEQYEGTIPFCYAALRGLNEVVEMLLAARADINTRDQRGQTPLMAAAAGGHVTTLNILLAKGADIHATDLSGLNAYAYASMNKHADAAGLLASKGADTMNYIKRDAQGMMERDSCEIELEETLRGCRNFLAKGISEPDRTKADMMLVMMAAMCNNPLLRDRLPPSERDQVASMAQRAREAEKKYSKKELFEAKGAAAYFYSPCARNREKKTYTRQDLDALGARLAAIWKEMAVAFSQNDIEKAVSFYYYPLQDNWRATLSSVPAERRKEYGRDLLASEIYVERVEDEGRAVCHLLKTLKGERYSFQLIFLQAEPGVWQIHSY
jgi:ankyrin repeat protein